MHLQKPDDSNVVSTDLFFIDPSALVEIHHREVLGPWGADDIDLSLLLDGLVTSIEASGSEPAQHQDQAVSSHLYAASALSVIFDDADAPVTGSLF